MSVFVQRVDPITTSKHRINESDLLNPALPHCDSKYWIVDGNAVREMTQAEKDQRWPPPPAPLPKDVRAERYKQEADPLLLAALGYGVELEAKPGDAALLQKQAQAKADYLAAKTKIRNEVKDA